MIKKIHLPHFGRHALARQYVMKKVLKYFPIPLNYFLKPNDGISYYPLLGIKHDEEVSASLIYLSSFLPDTFIDVGANIGLISLEVVQYFNNVVCIEPNPIVCNVLRSNTLLNKGNFEIHEVGIGPNSEELDLYIPKNNLGGAFVLKTNEYTQQELLQKDGYSEFNSKNYLIQKIKIEECADFIKKNQLDQRTSLVLKIDIEGQDGKVIDALTSVLEKHFAANTVALVFESHNLEIPMRLQALLQRYHYKILNPRIKTSPSMRMPILRRLIKLIRGESRELEFWPLEEPIHPVFKNFICAPNSFFEN
jgi:FkbM family methyltransferase